MFGPGRAWLTQTIEPVGAALRAGRGVTGKGLVGAGLAEGEAGEGASCLISSEDSDESAC